MANDNTANDIKMAAAVATGTRPDMGDDNRKVAM